MRELPGSSLSITSPRLTRSQDNLPSCLISRLILYAIAIGLRRSEKIFAYRREDVHQNHFLIQHCGAMPGAWRKVEHITGLGHMLLVADGEQHPATLDQRHLFVRVIVRRRNNARREAKATDHHLFADHHLPLDPFFQLFYRNAGPVGMLRTSVQGSGRFHLKDPSSSLMSIII